MIAGQNVTACVLRVYSRHGEAIFTMAYLTQLPCSVLDFHGDPLLSSRTGKIVVDVLPGVGRVSLPLGISIFN